MFKKDINDFIFTKTVAREIDGQQINQLRTPENGGSTTIDGVEFQVQHTFDNGFGGYANYTYTDVADAEIEEAVPVTDADGNIVGATLSSRFVSFPNTSKDSFNMAIFIVSYMNLIIHTPELSNISWSPWLVSPRIHLNHHQGKNIKGTYSAPTLNLEYLYTFFKNITDFN